MYTIENKGPSVTVLVSACLRMPARCLYGTGMSEYAQVSGIASG